MPSNPCKKKDFDAARKFAVDGMHLNWYTGNNLELYLYSKYFWYLEISRATSAWGAYAGDALVGVLLVDMADKPKAFPSIWYRAFVKVASFVINLGYKDASSTYDNANKDLLAAYRKLAQTDGELNFFAVAPEVKGQGVGTLLLNELERQEAGKRIYLFTDSGSTYQFYSRRGFDEVGRKELSLTIHGQEVPLTCLLFSKALASPTVTTRQLPRRVVGFRVNTLMGCRGNAPAKEIVPGTLGWDS